MAISNIMMTCVFLHKMIVEDERDLNLEFFYVNVRRCVKPSRNLDRIQAFLETYWQMEYKATHTQLHEDHIEHHW